MEKIDHSRLGIPAPEPLGDGQTLQSKTNDQGRKNSQLQDLQGQQGGLKTPLES